MKRHLLVALILLTVPSLALAHVSVRPRESKAGAEERYTVRVPTEGAVATTQVVLEIPAGLTVLEIVPHDGATFETTKQGDRITAITWKKEIPPKASAEFVLRATNPSAGDLVWKAHQHFADGSIADWVGVAGEKRPASTTKLLAAAGGRGGQSANDEASAVEAWLKSFDEAFNANDLERLASYHYLDVTHDERAVSEGPRRQDTARSERSNRGGEVGRRLVLRLSRASVGAGPERHDRRAPSRTGRSAHRVAHPSGVRQRPLAEGDRQGVEPRRRCRSV